MITENMLTEITIKNFKCFTDLHLEGFERVNLIGGKNNVGKTAFLEAVELNVSPSKAIELLYLTYKMIKRRQQNTRSRDIEFDFMTDFDIDVSLLSNKNNCNIKYTEQNSSNDLPIAIQVPSLQFIINKDQQIFPIERITDDSGIFLSRRARNLVVKANYISPTKIDERDIAVFYGALVDFNREDFLDKSLQLFDENILALKQKVINRDVVLKVQIKGKEIPVLLSSLGDGVNRFIAILCAIWASQDGFLFIDEIENGIHYTNYPKLWNIIFQASKDANCQLFITTHSKECIQAFNDANTADEGAYFEFYKNLKKNKITAQKLDNQQLNYALSHDGRVRGE